MPNPLRTATGQNQRTLKPEGPIFHGIKTKAYGHADRGGLVGMPHVLKGCNDNDNAEELDGFFWKR